MSKKYYIIPIFVPHIGCPHTCVFCNQSSITGDLGVAGGTGKIDGKYVEDTIEAYLATINNEDATIEVSFFGGTFTGINICKQRELLKVAKAYKDEGKIKYIRLSTRPDYINVDILKHLKEYRVDIIELGVQSLDEEVLHKSGRGHSEEDVIKASKLIRDYGFVLGHQLMLGLPGDTKEKDIASTRKSVAMKPDICRIYPALVIKDTPMERLLNKGQYKPYSMEEAVDVAKEVYGIYQSNDVQVIRVGLQPTEEINVHGDIVEGPFHPAFRELVEGSIYCDMIKKYIETKNLNFIEVFINPKDISKLYANKKEFFNKLKEKINKVQIKITQSNEIKRGILGFKVENEYMEISEKEYFISMYK